MFSAQASCVLGVVSCVPEKNITKWAGIATICKFAELKPLATGLRALSLFALSLPAPELLVNRDGCVSEHAPMENNHLKFNKHR